MSYLIALAAASTAGMPPWVVLVSPGATGYSGGVGGGHGRTVYGIRMYAQPDAPEKKLRGVSGAAWCDMYGTAWCTLCMLTECIDT